MPMLASATRMPNAEPNVTPMIDVLLVLLIVFMTIVVQVHHTMDVQLPTPCAGTCAGDPSIVLEIAPGPTYRINRGEVARSDLEARLRAIYLDRPGKIIQIAGHPGVRYAEIMAAMDVAKGVGVRVISIAPKATQLR
jgi:biopolymer transport protein ExbD